MSDLRQREVRVNDSACRVWELGDGPPLGILGGIRGLPRLTPFLQLLARHRRVIIPSLPGHPGSDAGHRVLDDTSDWTAMTLDLMEASDLHGAEIVAESIGATLALEAAAMAGGSIAKLVAIAPFGIYASEEPVRNPYATHMPAIPPLLAEDAEAYAAAFGPGSTDPKVQAEHELMLYRADEATARYIWPFGERGLVKRLHRVRNPTLLLWGSADRIVPASYAQKFADAISGPTEQRIIESAGHMVSIDAPKATAHAVLEFL